MAAAIARSTFSSHSKRSAMLAVPMSINLRQIEELAVQTLGALNAPIASAHIPNRA